MSRRNVPPAAMPGALAFLVAAALALPAVMVAAETPQVYVVIGVDTEADNNHPMGALHPTLDVHNYQRCAAFTTKWSSDGSTWADAPYGTGFDFEVTPAAATEPVTSFTCGSGTEYGLDRYALAGRFTVPADGAYDVRLQLSVTGSPPDTRIYVVPDAAGNPDLDHPLSTYTARAGAFASGRYVVIGSGLPLQSGASYWWVASRQSGGDSANRFALYSGSTSGSGSMTISQIMDPAFRNALRDSDGRSFRMTWYVEMDNFINNGLYADGRPMSYLTLYDELMNHWGAEVRAYGDEIAYHHHFMIWNGSIWVEGGQQHAVDGQYDEHNRALDRMVLDGGFFPADLRSGWLNNDNQLQAWIERWLLSDDGGGQWATAWRPYHPSATDYTTPGSMSHWMVNSSGSPSQSNIDAAFAQAIVESRAVVYLWTMHQRDDMWSMVSAAHGMLMNAASAHPGVPFRYVTTQEALRGIMGTGDVTPPTLSVVTAGVDVYSITADEPLGGSGPYVAGRYGSGSGAVYSHVPASPAGPPNAWTATLPPQNGGLALEWVGAGALDLAGNGATARFRIGSANTIAAAVPGDACISTAHPCVGIPVRFARADATPVRAYHLAVHLSPELAACGAGFTGGGYLGPQGATSFQVVDQGGGAYQVDEALAEPGCGSAGTGNGTLFTIELASAAAAGTGSITIDDVQVRDCAEAPVPAEAGPEASLLIDQTPPLALADLAVTSTSAGSDHNGCIKTRITFTPPADGSRVEVYRKGHGGYPGYAGEAPTLPARPGVADSTGWARTAVTATGQSDDPPVRDFWYYVAYTIDGCGNLTASGPSNGVLNYVLGDVSDGLLECSGDDRVNMADVSLLGARYESASGEPSYLACLDVGPTTDGAPASRPSPDGVLQFEDLVLLSLNYTSPDAPQPGPTAQEPAAAAVDTVMLEVPALPGMGQVFPVTLRATGKGDLQALRVRLAYDHAMVEMQKAAGGELLGRQAAPALVLAPKPGCVDVALLGRGPGLTGEGVLATVTFKVLAAGDPGLRIGALDGRDARNRRVEWSGAPAPPPPLPAVTRLEPPRPNPFAHSVTIGFSLARRGATDLVIYSVGGRRVRTLARGPREAGEYRLAWDGHDDGGHAMPPGVYYVSLITPQRSFTRKITYLR